MTREQIRISRKSQKLSQAELGKRMGLTATDISRIECGYRALTDEEATAIAAALGVSTKIGAGLAKAAEPEPAPAPAPASSLVVSPSVSARPVPGAGVPSGSDLNDPANFGVLPDAGILQRDSLDEAAFRTRLSAEVTRANTILHTPRVPAAVWRAWRQFEQQATALLRGEVSLTPAPPPAVVSTAAPSAPGQTSGATAGAGKLESKSFNSLFVEAARKLLPAETSARIGEAAEAARKADPSIGFMKHFRRLAENELDPVLLKQVRDETNQKLASPDRSRARRGRGKISVAAK